MIAKIANTLEHLKGQPMALALVLVNLLFLTWGAYMFQQFAQAGIRRDAMITAMLTQIQGCNK